MTEYMESLSDDTIEDSLQHQKGIYMQGYEAGIIASAEVIAITFKSDDVITAEQAADSIMAMKELIQKRIKDH